MNYCHSCGYDVADWHTSSTCPYQNPNHNWNATRADKCGGSSKGIHKTQWTWQGGAEENKNKSNTQLKVNFSHPTPTLNNYYCGACAENTKIQAKNYYAILYSGATDNFLIDSADVKNKQAEHVPINVTLPDKTKILSSHKFYLNLPNIPVPDNEAYILPGMKYHSLITVTKLCEAGCSVTFGKTECIVSKNGKELIRGTNSTDNWLWYIPISNNGKSFAI